METLDEIKPPVFSPEYADLEQPLRDAQQKSWDIDDQIENLPKDKGPQLAFRPPGYTDPNVSPNREQLISQLKDRQTIVKGDFNNLLEQRLANRDPQTAKQIRDTADYQLNNNSARKKSFDRSFEHMEKMYANRVGEADKADQGLPTKGQENLEGHKKDVSKRAMESLQHPDKSTPVQKYSLNAKDIIEPDKE